MDIDSNNDSSNYLLFYSDRNTNTGMFQIFGDRVIISMDALYPPPNMDFI